MGTLATGAPSGASHGVIYLTGSSGPMVREHAHRVGLLCQPRADYRLQRALYRCWAADNDQYGEATTIEAWWSWLTRQDPAGCLFATAPDVVGDWPASWERSRPWLPRIRALGFPAALVAQDGMTVVNMRATADEWDCLFIGGTTRWKESHTVVELVAAAHALGKPVHAGRVNSYRRFAHFAALGVRSCDGTFLTRAPDINVPRLLRWLDRWDHAPALPL